MTLWAGRFDIAHDPAAFDFGVSFAFDRALFDAEVTLATSVRAAHAVVLRLAPPFGTMLPHP